MEPQSPEQSSKETQPEPEILPNNIALALGRALEQAVDLPVIKMRMLSDNIDPNQLTEKEKKWLDEIRKNGIERVAKFIEDIKYSREIEIIQSGAGMGWDLKFSKEKKPQEENTKPQEGIITIDEELTSKIFSAISHNVNTAFTSIQGFSELMKTSPNTNLSEQMKTINNISTAIENSLVSPKFGGGKTHQLQLVTDANGNTTPIPILQASE